MVVRADLDRTVAGIGDRERHRLAAGIEFDLAVLDEEFAGDHLVLLPDRLMHGDELCAVGKRRLDLDVVDHLGDAVHALRAGDDLRA